MTVSITKPTSGQGPGWGTTLNTALDAIVTEVNSFETTVSTTYAPLVLTQTAQTGNYTFVLGDAFTLVEYNSSSAGTFTVPPNASVAFSVGTTIGLRQMGSGLLTMAPGAAVTIDSRGGALKMGGQYAEATLTKRATNEWVLSGDIST